MGRKEHLLHESLHDGPTRPELIEILRRHPSRPLLPPLGAPEWSELRAKPLLAPFLVELPRRADEDAATPLPDLTDALYGNYVIRGERLPFERIYFARRRQLARAGLFLAMDGRDPLTGEQVVKPHRARRINAIMMLCGHYDASGEFAFRVGLPGKSGVGGGILCIAPGQGSIAVWSPGLNEAGTSLVGAIALEHFAYAAGWSVFDSSTG